MTDTLQAKGATAANDRAHEESPGEWNQSAPYATTHNTSSENALEIAGKAVRCGG